MTQLDEATAFVCAYEGDFEFLTAMRERVKGGDDLSPGMVSAVLRCKARAEKQRAAEEPDPLGIDLSVIPLKKSFHAIPDRNGNVILVRIDNPTDGKWLGWSFVHQLNVNNPDAGRQKKGGTYTGNLRAAMLKLTNNWRKTIVLYGSHEGKCGACGRRLSPADKERGLGKACYKKVHATPADTE